MEQFQNQSVRIVTYKKEQVNQQRKKQIKSKISSLIDRCNVNLAHIGIKKMFPNIFSFQLYDIQETYNIIQRIFQSHQQILNQRDAIMKQFMNIQQRNSSIISQKNQIQRQSQRLQAQIRKLQQVKKTYQKSIESLTKQKNKQARQTRQGKQLNKRLKLELKNQKQKFQNQRQKYMKKQVEKKARQYQKDDVQIIQYSNNLQRHNFSQRVINVNINNKGVFDKGLQQKFKEQILKSTQNQLKKTNQENNLLRQWLHYFFRFMKQVNNKCMQTVSKIQQIQYQITQDMYNISLPMLKDRQFLDEFMNQTKQILRQAFEINLRHNKQMKEINCQEQKNIQAAQLVKVYKRIVNVILKEYQKFVIQKQQLYNAYLKYFPQTDHVNDLISFVTIQKLVSFNKHQQFVYNRLRHHRQELQSYLLSNKRSKQVIKQVNLSQQLKVLLKQIKGYNGEQEKNKIHKQFDQKSTQQERKMLLKDVFSSEDFNYIRQIMQQQNIKHNSNKVEIECLDRPTNRIQQKQLQI